mgnify:CR=1 FL=1
MVVQKYERGKDMFLDENKISLVATHYNNNPAAADHFKALKDTENGSLFDLENDIERQRFTEMLQPNSQFIIYTALTADKQKVKLSIDKNFKENIRRYIQKKTNWHIGGKETITPDLELIFGELFVILKYSGKQDLRVKMEEIEKA